MKKHLFLPLLICVAVFSACAQSRQAANSKGSEPAGSAAVAAKSISSVTMQRGACYGRCPEYSITINSGGLAEYAGKRNVEPLGVYQKNIGAAAAQSLLKQFAEYRVDTCKDLYKVLVSDVPGIYYSFIIDGKKKTIGNAHFGPPFLTSLSQEVDELGKVDGSWKKVKDAAE